MRDCIVCFNKVNAFQKKVLLLLLIRGKKKLLRELGAWTLPVDRSSTGASSGTHPVDSFFYQMSSWSKTFFWKAFTLLKQRIQYIISNGSNLRTFKSVAWEIPRFKRKGRQLHWSLALHCATVWRSWNNFLGKMLWSKQRKRVCEATIEISVLCVEVKSTRQMTSLCVHKNLCLPQTDILWKNFVWKMDGRRN